MTSFSSCQQLNFSTKRKSARKLRQGGSNYRCCIPALAGFVSPQSIAPDGKRESMQDRAVANGARNRESCQQERVRRNDETIHVIHVDTLASLCFYRAVKCLALLFLVVFQCSC